MKDYAGEDSVVFGDVLLRNDRITQGPNGGNLNPGKGGWPTVRYFNKETGYDGAPYVKKTGDAMCTVRAVPAAGFDVYTGRVGLVCAFALRGEC